MLDYDPNARAPNSAWIPVIIAIICAVGFNAAARADQFLAWSPQGTNRDNGSWQRVTDTTSVLCRAGATQPPRSDYYQGSITPFGSCADWVFACSLDIPVGQTSVCGANSSGEGFLPRAHIAGASPPPTCPPPQPADEAQTVQCAAPQVGSWTQTRSFSCPNPPTWTLGPWLPDTAPAGACVDPPPPVTVKASVPTGLRLESLATGSVTATWDAVSTRVDGSPFTTNRYALDEQHGNGTSAAQTTQTVSGLSTDPASNRFCFRVQALDVVQEGHSDLSAPVCIDLHAWQAPDPPKCNPKVDDRGLLYEGETVDGHTVKVVGCDMPDGYQWRGFGADPSKLADALLCTSDQFWRIFSLGNVQAAWRSCVQRPMSPTEQTLFDLLTARWKSRFVVSAIAATTACPNGCRPVYRRNADGTRGARVTLGGAAQSIAIGLECDGRRRLLGTTTRYHEISGMQSVTGQTLPPNSFTVCTIQNPPAAGWPQ